MRVRLRLAWGRLRAALDGPVVALLLCVVCTLPWLGIALAWRGYVYGWAACWGVATAVVVEVLSRREGGLAAAVQQMADALQQLARRQG